MAEPANYLEKAKAYWRFAPGGTGKVDSATLLHESDDVFLGTWYDEKRVRRLAHWDESDFIGHFAERVRGGDVFSFGCGLGFSEFEFLEAGATVVFADIVPSSVACAERLCRLAGYSDRCRFLVMDDSARTEFGGPYDAFFAYGSLMHMPADRQQRVLAAMSASLRPSGVIWLMLYTPRFVEATGVAFDEASFGSASDAGAGDLHNPWSDWHDDEKLQRLAGPDLRILRREIYNEGRYVWYELGRIADHPLGPIESFVNLAELERTRFAADVHDAVMVRDFDLPGMTAVDAAATVGDAGAVHIRTGVSQFHYALLSPNVSHVDGGTADRLVFEAEVASGGFSISIIDVYANLVVYTTSIARTGLVQATRDISWVGWPAVYRVVVANYCPAGAASSAFTLRRISLLRATRRG